MEEYNIKNLPDVLKDRFQNKEIKNIRIQKFPLKGYGSVMLKIDFTAKNKADGTEEQVHAVGKILPESEERREFFNIQVTYKNEVNFYQHVIPSLRAFQIENGVTDTLDIFADCYGARINLDGTSTNVTEDAVLVLENLVESEFKNISPRDGFDLDSAKFILADLAKLHGTLIAVKFRKPELFEKFKQNCCGFDFSQNDAKIMSMPPVAILNENPECAPLIPLVTSFFEKNVSVPREPYACITHCDMWVNNTMQKFENNTVVKNKFVDFQIINFRSCASDVFFFLWTSIQQSVLEKHFDDLIKFYHDNLVKTVKDLKCDVSSFSLEKFYEEIRIEADYEFTHSLMFACAVRGPALADVLKDGESGLPKPEDIIKAIPLALKEFTWFMTLECHKRGWVY